MSRALNINATQDDVRAACTKHAAAISTIETLPSGCTRVVLRSGDGAALVQRHFGKNIILTPEKRTPLSLAARGVPLTQDVAPPPPPQFSDFKKKR